MLKSKYDSVAQEYDRIRPGYPQCLFEDLVSTTRISDKSRLLEIGAGTGKSTMPLVKKGFKVDCIEIEPQMAEILMEKCFSYSNVSVIINSFEIWENIDKYDLIYCAQAFHWLDEEIKYKKCYSLLNEHGHLGLLNYISIIESNPLLCIINNVFEKYETGYSCTGINGFNHFIFNEENQLANSKYFKDIKKYIYEGEPLKQSADLFVARFNTTSAYASLPEEKKTQINDELSEVIDSNGGIVVSKLLYSLFIAEKV